MCFTGRKRSFVLAETGNEGGIETQVMLQSLSLSFLVSLLPTRLAGVQMSGDTLRLPRGATCLLITLHGPGCSLSLAGAFRVRASQVATFFQ